MKGQNPMVLGNPTSAHKSLRILLEGPDETTEFARGTPEKQGGYYCSILKSEI
jgi:hypothetical protein